jgi:hypothetical protein
MSDSEYKPSLEDLLPKPIPIKPPIPEGMDPFTMYRRHDESGVSGIGPIGQGVVFANGKVCFQFLCPPAAGDTQIKDSMDDFLNIHVKSHPTNRTIITFASGKQLFFPEEPTEEPKAE